MPLKVIESPYREITRPVLDYVRRVRKDNPRDVVTVFIPEYVVGHWWEQILHNQSALRLKGRLLFQPGVMVTSVPWQLASSAKARDRKRAAAPGDRRARRRAQGPTAQATGGQALMADRSRREQDSWVGRRIEVEVGAGRARRPLRRPRRGPGGVRPARAAR